MVLAGQNQHRRGRYESQQNHTIPKPSLTFTLCDTRLPNSDDLVSMTLVPSQQSSCRLYSAGTKQTKADGRLGIIDAVKADGRM